MSFQYDKEIFELAHLVEKKFIYNNFANTEEAKRISQIKSNNSLYDGFTGILLFLMRYYEMQESKNVPVYWTNFEKELDRLENLTNITNLNSLYFGRNSVSYLYLQYYLYRGNIKYLKKSISIVVQGERNFIKDKKNDLILGKAGNILLCCRIYEASKDKGILQIIKKLTQALIEEAKLSIEGGINWESDINVSQPLTGLSHGNSGVVLAIIEASKILKKQHLLVYAKLGIEYEDKFYNKKTLNWPDFRIDNYYNNKNDGTAKNLLKDSKDVKLKNYMSAWCHGSPGILLARIHLPFVVNKRPPEYLFSNLLSKICEETKKLKNNSLCHGISGNVAIMHCITEQTKNFHFFDSIKDLVDSSILKLKNDLVKSASENIDYSLFTGLTGAGLMLCLINKKHSEYAFTLTSTFRKTKRKVNIKELEDKYKTQIIKQLLINHQIKYSNSCIKSLQKSPIKYKIVLGVIKNEMKLCMNSSSIFNYLKLFTINSKFEVANNLFFVQFTKINMNNKVTNVLAKNSQCSIILNPFIAFINFNDKTYICNQNYFGIHTFIIDTAFYNYIIKIMKKERSFYELSKLIEIKFKYISIKEINKFIISLIENRLLILKF